MWNCRTCYNIVHYNCAKSWYFRNRVRGLRGLIWTCPQCQTEQDGSPRSRCWCGSQLFADLPMGSLSVPYSCENVCDRLGKCTHYTERRCGKICHPGKCDFPCIDSCPVGPPVPPNGWQRLRRRFKDRRRGQLCSIFIVGIFILLIYTALGVYLIRHIAMWTEPYNYPTWMHSNGQRIESTIGALGLGIILLAVLVLICGNTYEFAKFLNGILALNSTATNPHRKTLVQIFGSLLLIVIGAGVFALPCLG